MPILASVQQIRFLVAYYYLRFMVYRCCDVSLVLSFCFWRFIHHSLLYH